MSRPAPSTPNLPLKQAIQSRYKHLYRFANQLDVHPSVVTLVVTNRWRLSDEEKGRWAALIGKPVSFLFPKDSKN
jgi:hypothetical protein